MISDRLLIDIRERVLLVGVVALYYAIFIWTYRVFISEIQDSWGFSLHEIPAGYQMLNWVMVLVPALWLPLRLERPSLLLFLLQYIVVFIPCTIVIYNASLPEFEPSSVCVLLLTLFAALSIWQASYYIPLLKLRARPVSAPAFWSAFALLGLTLFGLVFGVLGANFRLTDLAHIYAVRFAAADLVTGAVGGLAQHAQMILAGAVLPLLFAAGVTFRQRWLYVVATGVYFFLFGVAGNKSAILGVPILAMIALWMRAGPARAPVRLLLGMTVLLLVPVLMSGDDERSKFLLSWYIALVHARIFAMQALITGQYYAFFQDHPYTFWSHVTGISAFVPYPYEIDVPRTIGQYYYTVNVGTNGGMWPSDGIAALGLPGVLIIAIVATVILWVFDSIAARHNVRFVVVALGFIAISFTNIPLPTTIVSGGALLLTLALYFMPTVATAQRRSVPERVTAAAPAAAS
jgi:hypothetical protein